MLPRRGQISRAVAWIASTVPAANLNAMHDDYLQNENGGFYKSGAELPPEVYLLLLMYYEGSRLPTCPFDPLTINEIATHMQRSESWVRKHVDRMGETGVCGPLRRTGTENALVHERERLGERFRITLNILLASLRGGRFSIARHDSENGDDRREIDYCRDSTTQTLFPENTVPTFT